MNDINSKNNVSNESPLPIRATEEYKATFRELSSKFHSQKFFFEKLIDNYISVENEKEQESKLSFSSDIGLIAYNLDSILKIFKSIAAKSQDTISSIEANYEQKLKNMNADLETERGKYSELLKENSSLSEKNILLDEANKGYINKDQKKDENISSLEEQIKSLKSKNSDLLNDLHGLRNTEKQNLILTSEKSALMKELKTTRDELEMASDSKDTEISNLSKLLKIKESDLSNEVKKSENLRLELTQCSEKFKEDLSTVKASTDLHIDQIKQKISKELELKHKEEILELKEKLNDLHTSYNKLQIEHLDLKNKKVKNQKVK